MEAVTINGQTAVAGSLFAQDIVDLVCSTQETRSRSEDQSQMLHNLNMCLRIAGGLGVTRDPPEDFKYTEHGVSVLLYLPPSS